MADATDKSTVAQLAEVTVARLVDLLALQMAAQMVAMLVYLLAEKMALK